MLTRKCANCSAVFEVDDSFKGKSAPCPQCNAISQPAAAIARGDGSARRIVVAARAAEAAQPPHDTTVQAAVMEPVTEVELDCAALLSRSPAPPLAPQPEIPPAVEAKPEAPRPANPPMVPRNDLAIDDIGEAHAPPTAPDLPAGIRISKTMGPYEVHQQIGRGGMGIVLQGRDKMLNRNVAIKILRPRGGDETVNRKRFIREAQITGQLEHPGIVPVHFLSFDEQGNSFFSMKLVAGRTLHKILDAWHRHDPHIRWEFPLHRLASIFERVCETVQFAHARNVIHCDLKPSNIMIGEYGEVWLLDWGVSKIMGSRSAMQRREMLGMKPAPVQSSVESKLTDGAVAGGTPCYMAPEQVNGGLLDDGTDIFALGGVLYEILTGRPPYEGATTAEIMLKAREGLIESALKRSETGRHAPRELAAIAHKCLSVQRGQRYSTVAELLRDLRAYAEGEPVAAYREPIFKRLGRFTRRHTRMVSVGLGLTALVLIGATVAAVLLAQNELSQYGKVREYVREFSAKHPECGEDAAALNAQIDSIEKQSIVNVVKEEFEKLRK